MDGRAEIGESAWTRGPYGSVYLALNQALDPTTRGVACRTDAIVSRTQDYLRRRGDGEALQCLQSISVQIETLRQGLRRRSPHDCLAARRRLTGLARDWLCASPMGGTQVS